MAVMQTRRTAEELAGAIYQCVSLERDGAQEAFDQALPEEQKGQRTIHELDYMDFGLMVGLAYGIARGEDPYERPDSVAERAGAAAAAAFDRWGHFSVTYAQDRAARPVPVLYPYTGGETAKPWEPLEDVANALETCEALVDEEAREELSKMGYRVAQIALQVMHDATGADEGEAKR